VLVALSTAALSFVLGWRFMEDYQRTRIDVWLNPELYADNEAYQTIQGMIGVGNGGFFGRGVRQGTQNVLHFVSLGGSNVLTMMSGLGILIGVSRSRHQRGR
jgi:rod shape determining protein RodA